MNFVYITYLRESIVDFYRNGQIGPGLLGVLSEVATQVVQLGRNKAGEEVGQLVVGTQTEANEKR